jgi:serine/threonine-protein kinase
MTNATPELQAGQKVLGYSILGLLAQGGMAEVYLARKQGSSRGGQPVVLKRIRPALVDDPQFIQMFVDEARLAKMLSHANVVQVLEVADDGKEYVLAMEFLDGRNLLRVARACYQRKAYIPYELMARVMADSLAGLDHAHNLRGPRGEPLNMVHRDMSPENIVITYAGVSKVVDFGIAKAANMEGRTKVGVIKGKLGYVSPEAVAGDKLDGRADVFSMGVTLYELLTYSVPFSGQNELETLTAVARKDPPAPHTLNPSVPGALEDICLKALEKNRARRWGSAAEMRQSLLNYIRTTGKAAGTAQLGAFMEALFPKATDKDRLRVAELLQGHTPEPEQPAAPPPRPASPGTARAKPAATTRERSSPGSEAKGKPRNLVAEAGLDQVYDPARTMAVGPAWSKLAQLADMVDASAMPDPTGKSQPPMSSSSARAVLPKRAPEERGDRTEAVDPADVPSPGRPTGRNTPGARRSPADARAGRGSLGDSSPPVSAPARPPRGSSLLTGAKPPVDRRGFQSRLPTEPVMVLPDTFPAAAGRPAEGAEEEEITDSRLEAVDPDTTGDDPDTTGDAWQPDMAQLAAAQAAAGLLPEVTKPGYRPPDQEVPAPSPVAARSPPPPGVGPPPHRHHALDGPPPPPVDATSEDVPTVAVPGLAMAQHLVSRPPPARPSPPSPPPPLPPPLATAPPPLPAPAPAAPPRLPDGRAAAAAPSPVPAAPPPPERSPSPIPSPQEPVDLDHGPDLSHLLDGGAAPSLPAGMTFPPAPAISAPFTRTPESTVSVPTHRRGRSRASALGLGMAAGVVVFASVFAFLFFTNRVWVPGVSVATPRPVTTSVAGGAP